MQDPRYRCLFPGTVIVGKNTETELETAHGGFRLSTSVGGTLTGRGGDLILIDDPQKPEQAMSKVTREHVWDWFIPSPIDQNRCAHWRSPMDMMRQG
jgi:hypothetical protein